MRALLTLALTAVIAAIAVDAALVLHNHPVVLEHKRRQAELAAGEGENNNTGSSAVYQRIFELGIAVTTGNYTWMESLIDDNAVIFIAGLGCGTLTKGEFVNAAKSSPVVARYFDLGAWAGYDDQSALPLRPSSRHLLPCPTRPFRMTVQSTTA
jgi:hypothetical protein